MSDNEIKQYIDYAIKRTINEYKRCGLLRDSRSADYEDASQLLTRYFDGWLGANKAQVVREALQEIESDSYFGIIPLYYQSHFTMEEIAEKMGVDTSTIVRNKKRLCLSFFSKIGG